MLIPSLIYTQAYVRRALSILKEGMNLIDRVYAARRVGKRSLS